MADTGARNRHEHWDATYARVPVSQLSWYDPVPVASLELITALGVPHTAAVIDVGGGASTLVDNLLARGFADVSVLDVSAAALATTRDRLGSTEKVQLLHEDITTWRPARRYGLWHDRALLHFLVEDLDRERYLAALRTAIEPGGFVVVATFAPDGPERCSGLTVRRYAAGDLAALLGDGFQVLDTRVEEHVTPAGVPQSFTWVAARATR